MTQRIVIIGAGQAGGTCAKALRDNGFGGEIALIGDEGRAPYERPPLSKDVLLGEADFSRCALFSDELFGGLGLDFRDDDPARHLDRTAKRVRLRSGAELDYDALVLATGGYARTIPGMTGEGFYTLRNLDDCRHLRRALGEEGKTGVCVIGGGWIGLEVAATAQRMGLEVTVIEAADRLCARVAPPRLSDYLLDLHRRQGVDIRLETTAELFGDSALRLSNGEVIAPGVVVLGIGMVANTVLAEEAGLAVQDGVVVNDRWQSDDPNVYAIGDCARRHGIRAESWANAQFSAEQVARILCGQEPASDEIPWFWSDQYGVNIQMLGTQTEDCDLVIRGDPSQDRASLFYVQDRLIRALVTIDMARDMAVGRRLVSRALPVARASLMDEQTPLRSLLT